MDQKNLPSGPDASEAMREFVPVHNRDTGINVRLRYSNSDYHLCTLHWHEALEFYYVRQGGVCLLCNGSQQWLMPGDVGFVNWCQPHRGSRFLDGTRHYIIQFAPSLFSDEVISCLSAEGGQGEKQNLLLQMISEDCTIPTALRQQRELTAYLDIIIQESEEKAPGYELKCRAAALNVLAFLLRQGIAARKQAGIPARELPQIQYLKRALTYLSQHYTHPEEVTLSALSRELGLSAPYICRIFKNYTTLTLTAYVSELRCTRACDLIRNGVSLEKTAQQVGFQDYNYFSRMFKKTMGLPPSAFRDAGGKSGNPG